MLRQTLLILLVTKEKYMAKQYLRVKNYSGLNTSNPDIADPSTMAVCKNMFNRSDVLSTSNLGILNKFYKGTHTAASFSEDGHSLGIYWWRANDSRYFYRYISGTTDADLIWDKDPVGGGTLIAAATEYYMTFEPYGGRLFFCNGTTDFRKHNADHTNWNTTAPTIKDKGGTATAIAGATLTWNATATVTSDIDVSAIIGRGDWIRRSSSSAYWDEVLTINGAGTTITLSAASADNGASAVGGAQYAATATTAKSFKPMFMKSWKEQMWVWGGIDTFPQRNTLWWSTVGDPEDWSGSGSGFVTVEDGLYGTAAGIDALDDYLFLFKDRKYYVYRYTGDSTAPIVLVRTHIQECVSAKSIVNIGDAIVYFTGSDVRMTNGNQDVSIGTPQIYDDIISSVTWRLTGYSNLVDGSRCPSILYDEIREMIFLNIPHTTAGQTRTYVYDLKTKSWVSKITDNIGELSLHVYPQGYTYPNIIAQDSINDDYLHTYGTTTLDYTSAGELFTPAIDFGALDKKKKINYVEFTFHPQNNCGSTVKFNWWDFNESKARPTAGSTGEQTYDLSYTGGSNEYRVKKRFYVNADVNQFGWCMFETVGGTAGWGIVDWTICYEITDNT